MRRALSLAGLALLAACGDWPELGIDAEVAGFPVLVPFETVVAPGETAAAEAARAAEADAALLARAEALRTRAATLAPDADDRRVFDALRARPAPRRRMIAAPPHMR
jgi:hypothetical protein